MNQVMQPMQLPQQPMQPNIIQNQNSPSNRMGEISEAVQELTKMNKNLRKPLKKMIRVFKEGITEDTFADEKRYHKALDDLSRLATPLGALAQGDAALATLELSRIDFMLKWGIPFNAPGNITPGAQNIMQNGVPVAPNNFVAVPGSGPMQPQQNMYPGGQPMYNNQMNTYGRPANPMFGQGTLSPNAVSGYGNGSVSNFVNNFGGAR